MRCQGRRSRLAGMSHAAILWTLAAVAFAAFWLGSVPFGLIVGKLRGVDIRGAGSGNIGATNAGRLLGRKFFFLVLVLDALKSALPAGLASALVHINTLPPQRTPTLYGLWLLCGVAAMLGHVFSPFLGFRGGKGVATALGLVLGVVPLLLYPGLVSIGVFVLAYRLSGYISLGSVLAAAAFPLAYLGFAWPLGWDPLGRQWPVLLLTCGVAALIVWRHRGNLARLRAGTESRAR